MKLIRDRTPGLLPDSTRIATHDERAMLLRAKLMEEAAEAGASTSRSEMVSELGDLYEVMLELGRIYDVQLTDIIVAARKKREEKGGFGAGVVLLHDPEWNKNG